MPYLRYPKVRVKTEFIVDHPKDYLGIHLGYLFNLATLTLRSTKVDTIGTRTLNCVVFVSHTSTALEGVPANVE